MFQSKLKYTFFIILLLTLLSFESIAQDYRSKGNEFWLTFIPNIHANRIEPSQLSYYQDSLHIFIAIDEPTNCKIEYRDSSGKYFTQNRFLSDINKIHTFSYLPHGLELEGVNNSTDNLFPNQNERAVPNHFRITTDKNVFAFAQNEAVFTSDATMLMPVNTLGKEYLIASYPNLIALKDNIFKDIDPYSSMPSQFAILAIEDNTKISILPKSPTTMGRTQEFEITLNRGESYLVQALISKFNSLGDLTGSIIRADKNVAVFAGHQRTQLPKISKANSRDCLLEQMPTIQSLSSKYFITPFEQVPVTFESQQVNDIYRVIAAFDSTEVYLDDVLIHTLQKGQFYEADILEAAVLNASRPVMLALYKKTSSTGNSGYSSDPFLIIAPSEEQFMKSYKFVAYPAKYSYINGINEKIVAQAYDTHFVNIVIHKNFKNTLILDGNKLNNANFKPISNSDYVYLGLTVDAGSHRIEADTVFGLYVYGYGPANSYGYLAGIDAKPKDFNPVRINYSDDCLEVNGVFSDTMLYDYGIKYAKINEQENVEMKLDSINSIVWKFNLTLENKFQDGFALIEYKDKSDNYKQDTLIEIAGFTIAISETGEENSQFAVLDSGTYHRKLCYNYKIENYGKFPQKLSLSYIDEYGTHILADYQDIIIEPKESKNIEFCKTYIDTGTYNIKLIAQNDCIDRQILSQSIVILEDKMKPYLSALQDACNTAFQFTIADSGKFNSSILNIDYSESKNVKFTLQKIDYYNENQILAEVEDKFQDAYIKIKAIDAQGNISEFEKEIPGFTVEFILDEKEIDFGSLNLYEIKCLPIKIHNYGKYEFDLSNLIMQENLIFSFPASTVVSSIKSKDTLELVICINSNLYGKVSDLAKFNFNCLEKSLLLKGEILALPINTSSRCVENISIIIDSNVEKSFLENLYPNPSNGKVTINFGLHSKSDVNINIYNKLGLRVSNYNLSSLPNGLFSMDLDVTNLASDTYILELQLPNSSLIQNLIISK